MAKNLEQKVIIITGASSGIGKALALEFASMGASLCLASRNAEKLSNTEVLIGDPSKCMSQITDVSEEKDCLRLVESCLNTFGRIDIVVSNAGQSMRADFEDTHQKVMERVMATNYWGAIYMARHSLKALTRSKGVFVGVSSIGAYLGLPGRVAYCSSKAALQSFLEVFRMEQKGKGIDVLNVAPGFTKSEIRRNALLADGSRQGYSSLDESKMEHPEVIAKRIIKAILSRRRDLIMSRQGRAAILLRRLFPSIADQYFVYCKKKEDKRTTLPHQSNN